MEIIEKVIEKDCNHEKYATKGRANTGIALGAALGGAALLGQFMSGNGLFGFGGNRNLESKVDAVAAKECQDALDLTKFIYEQRIDINNNRFADREQLNSEIFKVYNTQLTSDFELYKSQRDGFDVLAKRISDLETKEAVSSAVEPWRAKVLEMQIHNVNQHAQSGLALEAERRYCADSKIVNYANSTFVPQTLVCGVPDIETAKPAPIYNPLCPCPTLV